MRQNIIRVMKNLKHCICSKIPLASTALTLSSPSTKHRNVARTASNVLQTTSTARNLQVQHVSESF